MDTGADVTCVSLTFLQKAGLVGSSRPHADGLVHKVKLAGGVVVNSDRVVDIELLVQVMLDTSADGEDPIWVHWDRRILLADVWVLPFGDDAPRDLFVSYADWDFGGKTTGPLGELSQLVLQGARIVASPRAPRSGELHYALIQRDAASKVPAVTSVVTEGGDPKEKHTEDMSDDELRALIYSRIPKEKHGLYITARLVDVLLDRRKIFNRIDASEVTEIVDMTVVGSPTPVSFKVKIRRGAQGEAATEGLHEWVRRRICERVPWDTPSYGFVIVVPKAGGKWRVTVNPTETNKSTVRDDPEGGFMPDSMLMEAQRAGRRCRLAVELDYTEAFTSLKLSPKAQELSTFTTPIGKLRWLNGYYGWHSFPVKFQRMMMEKVILPTMDELTDATILGWIDDLIAGTDDPDTFISLLVKILERSLALGLRLNLRKCHFLADVMDWCGVDIDVKNNQWRIARHRVSSLAELPIPEDHEGLLHAMGVLRYYFFGITDHKAQRERLAKLKELDVQGIRLKDHWKPEHTKAFRDALNAVTNGDWLMVYDPTKEVYVWTDASGKHGYCVAVAQFDKGKLRPIAFYSVGWLATQVLWSAQVKEAYGQRQAMCVVVPRTTPFASVVLLCDNKNLSAQTDSQDQRVIRWQHDIKCSGCVVRRWTPGEWNTIADYGSRAVHAQPDAQLSEEEKFELHLYALLTEGDGADGEPVGVYSVVVDERLDDDAGTSTTLVPGHLYMAPMAAKIAGAQAQASEQERLQWAGGHYSTAVLGQTTLYL
jgi:hypothetical protein